VLWLNDTKKFNALQKIAVEEEPVEDSHCSSPWM